VLGRNCEDCNKGELEENLLKKGRRRAARPLSAAEPVERRPGLGSSHYAAIPAAVPCEAGSCLVCVCSHVWRKRGPCARSREDEVIMPAVRASFVA